MIVLGLDARTLAVSALASLATANSGRRGAGTLQPADAADRRAGVTPLPARPSASG